MKIYGKNFRAVFNDLPWAYKVVVPVGVAFILFILIYLPLQFWERAAKTKTIEPIRITFSGTKPASVFDPSLAYDAKSQTHWMAFVADEGRLAHVRIASSGDKDCKNWQQRANGFEAKSDDILAPDGQTVFRTGVWRIETPSLVHDPDDAGREWKLYAYKYFWSTDPASRLEVAQHYGMIVYKHATDPAGDWSTEQWLFSPAPDYPPPPYEQMILLQLNRLDPSLRDVVAYSRPSVIYKNGALMMTLSAFTDGDTPDRVILISSADHGKSWLYLGTPLRQSDMPGLGAYTKLAGATLVEQQGQVYLAAVPGNELTRGQGTLILSFDDFSKGRLKRNVKTGAPEILNSIPLNNKIPGPLGGGFAAYSAACPSGMLIGEQVPNRINLQILKTHQNPLAK